VLLKIPPHLICIAILLCEISDDAVKPATTLTNCVINVDRARHMAPKQPRLKSDQLCSLGERLQQINYHRRQFTTINQLKQAIVIRRRRRRHRLAS